MNDPGNNDQRRFQQQYDDQQHFSYADQRRDAYPQAPPPQRLPVLDGRMFLRVVLAAVVAVLTITVLQSCAHWI